MEGAIKSITNLTGIQSKGNEAAKNKFSAQLISDISLVSEQLKDINEKYNLTSDNDLIESLIYEELSLKARYGYLLRLAKVNNVHYTGNYMTER